VLANVLHAVLDILFDKGLETGIVRRRWCLDTIRFAALREARITEFDNLFWFSGIDE